MTANSAARADDGVANATSREDAVQFWKYADCVADRHFWRVEKLLWLPKDSDKRASAAKKLGEKSSSCLRSNMRVSRPLFVNALTGAYITRKFAEQPLPDFTGVAHKYRLSALPEDASEKRMLRRALYQFAECLVRTAPEQSKSLFRTEPFSERENAVIDTLRPTMSACLPVHKGAKLGFSRTDFRAVLGRVTFELIVAQRTQENTDA